jgi:hypothetical protein
MVQAVDRVLDTEAKAFYRRSWQPGGLKTEASRYDTEAGS